MPELPRISVIVPTYNRPAALRECLDALAKQDYPRDRFEVIVVDDGSAEDPSPAVEAFQSAMDLKLLKQANAGPGAARNTGSAAARFEILAFTDDDCRPHADWLHRLSEALAADPEALVGGLCINAYPDNLYCVTSQMILDVVNAHFNRDPQRAIFFPSDNIAVTRLLFQELGGFDPAFRCSEDRDFCDRWAAGGRRLVFHPEAKIDHARNMGLRGFCKQHFGYGKGAWRFHAGRAKRHSGAFEVDGNFYLKCFREPWRTQPVHCAIVLTGLLIIWQVFNTAGFFYERFKPARRP